MQEGVAVLKRRRHCLLINIHHSFKLVMPHPDLWLEAQERPTVKQLLIMQRPHTDYQDRSAFMLKNRKLGLQKNIDRGNFAGPVPTAHTPDR